MHIDQASEAELRELEASLTEQYKTLQNAGLDLDLTRGKPGPEQLDLSNALDGILQGELSAGTDLRNYGGLDGIAEAKELFAGMIQVEPNEILIGGNASLTLMYFSVLFALQHDLVGAEAWSKQTDTVKFLCPVPGYDRHFSVCEHLGIDMIPVPMDDNGPDMDQVEALVKSDPNIKGMWCVPRFSNPSGIVYSDEVVARIARLGNIAGAGFRVFWDNAYAVHTLYDDAPQVASLMDACRAEGTADSVYIFGSTSKVTFAGAGISFLGATPENLQVFQKHLGMTTIGPDKINQMRHVKFLRDSDTIAAHMRKHAAILRPRFEAVIETLERELENTGMGEWTAPKGGYFISFDTRPGVATNVVLLAKAAGVKLTPAGATFPYGKDPDNRNIRIAPSFASVEDIKKAMDVFVVCVKLASVQHALR